MLNYLIKLAENGTLPDYFIKKGIEKLCYERLSWADKIGAEKLEEHHQEWINILKNSPIALVPEKANEQHYELPPEFFDIVLGDYLKYSCGYWKEKNISIHQSEKDMLDIYSERAQLDDNMQILELGCGWGSLTCYMGEKYPNSKITAVSNSKDQKAHIEARCKKLGLTNITIITCDMNDFDIDETFDRVVSIEMFEHMRNYKLLLNKVSKFLNAKGKLFIHIFSHHTMVYPYEDNGPGDWMAREFFSGGLMPSHNLLLNFQDDLKIDATWKVNGQHYEKTSYAWLENMDNNKKEIISIFNDTYGVENSKMWFQRWRIFFLSCAVMFGIKEGTEWGVSHYRFVK
tara:strand:- start:4707 stop:5738 length:1032 start_codon:yes stop_codon:yes gene_type:complete